MNTIARLILFTLLLLVSQQSRANLWVDSIRVVPTTITENDLVQIRLYTNLTTFGNQVYINYSITPGNIWITGCHRESLAQGNTYYADTFNLGRLAEGQYQINFLGYTAADSQCSNILDSTKVTDSFYVLPLMTVTQTILPLNATENDSVKIAVSVTTPNPARKISLSYILGQNDILIKGCFAKTQAIALPQTFNDTLVIGKLQQGGYRSHVTVFYSVGDTNICDTVVDFTQLLDSFTVTKTVFVDDHRLANTSVYPNPTSGEVNILLPEGIEIEQVALQDITGRIVKTATAGRVSVADLPGGLYILQVQTNAGRFVQKLRKE
jgi:hypothetical protein